MRSITWVDTPCLAELDDLMSKHADANHRVNRGHASELAIVNGEWITSEMSSQLSSFSTHSVAIHSFEKQIAYACFGSGPDPSAILLNGEKEIGSLKKVNSMYTGTRGVINGVEQDLSSKNMIVSTKEVSDVSRASTGRSWCLSDLCCMLVPGVAHSRLGLGTDCEHNLDCTAIATMDCMKLSELTMVNRQWRAREMSSPLSFLSTHGAAIHSFERQTARACFGSGPDPSAIEHNGEKEIGSLKNRCVRIGARWRRTNV